MAILGSAPKEHRSRATQLYQRAVDAHQRAKESSTCANAIAHLCEAKSIAAIAMQESYNVGAQIGRQSGAVYKAIGKLRKKLENDFKGAMAVCVRKYPE
jgi:hypothetical protein